MSESLVDSTVTNSILDGMIDDTVAGSILNGMIDGVVVISKQGTILEVNQAVQDMFGYRRSELIGQNVCILMPEHHSHIHDRYISNYLDTGKPKIIGHGRKELGKRKDGTTFPLDIGVSEVQNENQHLFIGTVRDLTEQKDAEEHAIRLGRILDASWNEVYIFDMESLHFVQVSHGAEHNLGYTSEELTRLTAIDIKPEFTRERFHKLVEPLVAGTKQQLTFETIHQRKDGSTYPVEIRLQISRSEKAPVFVAIIQDITERHRAEEQLFREKERAEVTLQSIADAVMTTTPEGIVQYMNPAAEELTGWRNSEAQGKPLIEVFQIINELTRQVAEDPVKQCLRDGAVVSLANHTVLIRRDGQEISIEDSAAPIRDRDGKIIGVVMVFHDCSNERELKHQLSHQASHDSLTGLANRRKFERTLEEALISAKKHDLTHALIYLDLDQFKVVNDTCGHVAGDELLRQLSMVLKKEVRETDTLARLGGDEFGILLEGSTLENAKHVADKLRQTVRDFRFVWQGKTFDIGASIGLTDITAESEDSASLLSAADVACYTAKEMGRNRIHVYTDGDTDLAMRQGEMQWVSRIQQALDENRLCLYGQAIVPVTDKHTDGDHFEVLVRMLDEQGQIIPPGAFLPAAERYNLMPTIDRWVISQVFSNYSSLGCSHAQCQLSINLSGTSLNDDDFLDFIHAQFQEYDVPPKNINFEITETAVVANLVNAIHFINELKSIGCRFALDDFGSGISSFAYLKNLPVDYLKIDGNFVKDMVNDPIDWAMVESINKIGHVMGIKTIAEYVETDAIMHELRKIGVDYAQGYGIGIPKPLFELCEKC